MANRPQRIIAALTEHGPLSLRDLVRELGDHYDLVSAALGAMRPSRVHISAYRRDSDGGRLYPRALWAAGPGTDAKPPGALSDTQYNQRHRAVKRGAVNSVWALGTPVEVRRVGRRAL